MTFDIRTLPVWGTLPFQELNQECPTAEKGDWVLKPGMIKSTRCWKLYAPKNDNEYNCYNIGFSGESQSLFTLKNYKKGIPIIFKVGHPEVFDELKQNLSNLRQPQRHLFSNVPTMTSWVYLLQDKHGKSD